MRRRFRPNGLAGGGYVIGHDLDVGSLGRGFLHAFRHSGVRKFLPENGTAFAGEPATHDQRNVFIDRAGVCLLFGHAEFGEQIQDHVRFHLKLPRQLVDANFLHI